MAISCYGDPFPRAISSNDNSLESQSHYMISSPWALPIIPKSHFPSLDATPSVVAAMCSKVPFISNAMMKATGRSAFNLLVNNGPAAGQVIYHTHIHIIPRKAYDCLWASESLLRRRFNVDDEKVSQLAARIQKQLLPSDTCQ
ncbi:unnamed protein product [Sphenostylis stenocarpa]|uniref:HIT domain-containing protein n=1 Tax=Sphenostylis stenocarpa TaxID=92480 RepID=A0AA86V3G2_9FABA|nr:unnamed protein product [Sphenostylis stenocarpa]